jgi:hypothetical protein
MKRHIPKILAGVFALLALAFFLRPAEDVKVLATSADVTTTKVESKASVPAPAPTYTPLSVPADASEREKKVMNSLNKFVERTEGITAESIAAEREKVKEGLKKSLESPTETPKTTVITDENGDKWEKLEYKDGIVRYVPIASTLSSND